MRFGLRKAVFLGHPDLIEEMLVDKARLFQKSSLLKLLRPLLGEGLLLSEGSFWLRQRRLMQPAFHRERIASYGETMVRLTQDAIASWKPGESRDLHAEMMEITRRIVTRCLFGSDTSGEGATQSIEVIFKDFERRRRSFGLLPSFLSLGRWRLTKALRHLDRLVYGLIENSRRRSPGEDLLSLLLQVQDEAGSRMTDRQLRDEVMTLFLAGHETTAVALSWTWYLLAQNPAADARLAQELAAVLGGRPPTAGDFPQLSYTQMVVSEAMRLYPPGFMLAREAVADTELAGRPIKKGTLLLTSPWAMHRSERFFDDPLSFRPERWSGDLAKRLPRFAYFPFGGGPRLCIGNSFALMEAVLVTATIAQKFSVRLDPPPGVRITPMPYVTLRPEPGLPVRLQRR